MRIVRWAETGSQEARFGLWIDDMIADAGTAAECGVPEGAGVEALLGRGMMALEQLESRAVTRRRLPRSGVHLLPPLARPTKIFCLGLNYLDHAREQGKQPPPSPVVFMKPPSSITGPHDDIVLPPFCQHVDHEIELAFVIGKRAKNVPAARARSHIAGYLVLNDVTDRKIQKDEVQNSRAKGFDTFCPLGPALVTANEVSDPGNLLLRLSVDGVVRQEARTSNMIQSVEKILEFLSRGLTLEPGDVVATGTPAGVGVFRDPKVFLEDGQVVRAEIEGLGILENRVRREAA
jgi:2-keto-4-pentenoate hydratase/2-oxohepta-3-ene-1,7-dioic acid hydratase in catechol pathway